MKKTKRIKQLEKRLFKQTEKVVTTLNKMNLVDNNKNLNVFDIYIWKKGFQESLKTRIELSKMNKIIVKTKNEIELTFFNKFIKLITKLWKRK